MAPGAASASGVPDVQDVEDGVAEAVRDAPRVTISSAALAAIYHEIHVGGTELETGGILLGHTRAKHIHIDVAGDPGPNAKRTPDRFSRDLDHAEELAQAAWAANRAHWVGDWHTHPNTPAVPSPVDLGSYLEHLGDPDLDFDTFVSVIAAVSPSEPPDIVCWVIRIGNAVSVPLEIKERSI